MTYTNPFSSSKSKAGYGEIHLTLLPPNVPSFRAISYSYPLKLVSSSPHVFRNDVVDDEESPVTRVSSVPLVFLLSYGGGLLPPDALFVNITLEPYTRLTLTTQGSTKIFPSPPRELQSHHGIDLDPHVATQDLNVIIKAKAALLLCPDPSQPFKGSNYSQTQIFQVQETSSLGLLDWVTSGRPARGEVWDAGSWKGKNEVWLARASEPKSAQSSQPQKRLLLRDNVILTGGSMGIGQSSLRAERIGVFGTFILYGPIFQKLGAFFADEFAAMPRIGGRDWGDKEELSGDFNRSLSLDKDGGADLEALSKEELEAWRRHRLQHEKANGVLWTAARVRGLVLVKFGAREVEGAREWLGMMCRREGTIATEFGPGGLMALQ